MGIFQLCIIPTGRLVFPIETVSSSCGRKLLIAPFRWQDRWDSPPNRFEKWIPTVDRDTDLKLKDIAAGVRFSNAQVEGTRFTEDFVQACKKLDALNKFLAGALDLPW